MAIGPGSRLGPYEVTALIGEGGMGKVWRAHHTGLKRDDALKVLPDAFASDPDRLARFQREAQVLASLNHPNIAHVYGLEHTDGVQALVMELVEGPTLADRIAHGPIPVDEALPIAKQIAEALEAAHEQGIVHRDLKPANIKVRPDGTVKVLDFGLAKALEPTFSAGADVTASPTITSPAMTTGVGVLLGTAAYMSPEQARGKAVDRRTDIWAFGAVLYEMLTGRRAFEDEDVSMTLSKVLQREPDFEGFPGDVPTRVRHTVRLCLRKSVKERIPDIRTVQLSLQGVFETVAPQATQSAVVARPLWRRVTPAATALVVAALVTGGGVWWLTRPGPASVVRTTLTASGRAALTPVANGNDRSVAITPDGSRVVYRGDNQLLVRTLNLLEPDTVGGLGIPRGPFISPDGQWIGFFDNNVLKKVAITGGPPVTIVKVDGAGPRGATWLPDGTIVYATAAPDSGLQRVSAAGGEPAVLTKPDRERGEADHFWPEFLPGGVAVLFTITQAGGGAEGMQVAVFDLRSGTSKILIRGGSDAHYVPSGQLVYGVAGTLRAVAFDLGRLEVIGTPVPVLEGVITTDSGVAEFAVAANGSLVYVPGAPGASSQQNVIVSVDRQGRASTLPGLSPDSYRDVRVSPDGSRLALATATDVWTYDFARATLSRLTTDSAADTRPLWTPDGQYIVFSSNRAGYPEIFRRPADGTGSDERLLTRAKELLDLRASSLSADGEQLLFGEVYPNLKCTIGQLALKPPSEVKVLVTSEFCNDHPTISPDGRWMAYQATVSGRYEIYVERYPELGSRQQISTAGGQRPIWSHNGRELFFSDLNYRQILTVPVQSGTTLVAGRPQVLFNATAVGTGTGGARPYDVAPDGRFLIIRSGAAEEGSGVPSNLVLVQNWQEELKRLVPTN